MMSSEEETDCFGLYGDKFLKKNKRTRQRVDAGEPRNSYSSIPNFSSRPSSFMSGGLYGAIFSQSQQHFGLFGPGGYGPAKMLNELLGRQVKQAQDATGPENNMMLPNLLESATNSDLNLKFDTSGGGTQQQLQSTNNNIQQQHQQQSANSTSAAGGATTPTSTTPINKSSISPSSLLRCNSNGLVDIMDSVGVLSGGNNNNNSNNLNGSVGSGGSSPPQPNDLAHHMLRNILQNKKEYMSSLEHELQSSNLNGTKSERLSPDNNNIINKNNLNNNNNINTNNNNNNNTNNNNYDLNSETVTLLGGKNTNNNNNGGNCGGNNNNNINGGGIGGGDVSGDSSDLGINNSASKVTTNSSNINKLNNNNQKSDDSNCRSITQSLLNDDSNSVEEITSPQQQQQQQQNDKILQNGNGRNNNNNNNNNMSFPKQEQLMNDLDDDIMTSIPDSDRTIATPESITNDLLRAAKVEMEIDLNSDKDMGGDSGSGGGGASSGDGRTPSPTNQSQCGKEQPVALDMKRARVENIVSSMRSSPSLPTSQQPQVNGCKKRKLYHPQQHDNSAAERYAAAAVGLNLGLNLHSLIMERGGVGGGTGSITDNDDDEEDTDDLGVPQIHQKRLEKDVLKSQLRTMQEQLAEMQQKYVQLCSRVEQHSDTQDDDIGSDIIDDDVQIQSTPEKPVSVSNSPAVSPIKDVQSKTNILNNNMGNNHNNNSNSASNMFSVMNKLMSAKFHSQLAAPHPHLGPNFNGAHPLLQHMQHVASGMPLEAAAQQHQPNPHHPLNNAAVMYQKYMMEQEARLQALQQQERQQQNASSHSLQSNQLSPHQQQQQQHQQQLQQQQQQQAAQHQQQLQQQQQQQQQQHHQQQMQQQAQQHAAAQQQQQQQQQHQQQQQSHNPHVLGQQPPTIPKNSSVPSDLSERLNIMKLNSTHGGPMLGTDLEGLADVLKSEITASLSNLVDSIVTRFVHQRRFFGKQSEAAAAAAEQFNNDLIMAKQLLDRKSPRTKVADRSSSSNQSGNGPISNLNSNLNNPNLNNQSNNVVVNPNNPIINNNTNHMNNSNNNNNMNNNINNVNNHSSSMTMSHQQQQQSQQLLSHQHPSHQQQQHQQQSHLQQQHLQQQQQQLNQNNNHQQGPPPRLNGNATFPHQLGGMPMHVVNNGGVGPSHDNLNNVNMNSINMQPIRPSPASAAAAVAAAAQMFTPPKPPQNLNSVASTALYNSLALAGTHNNSVNPFCIPDVISGSAGGVGSGVNVSGRNNSSSGGGVGSNGEPNPEQNEALSLVVTPKKKRHKVTDTRITPRTVSRILAQDGIGPSPNHLEQNNNNNMNNNNNNLINHNNNNNNNNNKQFNNINTTSSSIPTNGGMSAESPSPRTFNSQPPTMVPVTLPTSVAIPNPSLHESQVFSPYSPFYNQHAHGPHGPQSSQMHHHMHLSSSPPGGIGGMMDPRDSPPLPHHTMLHPALLAHGGSPDYGHMKAGMDMNDRNSDCNSGDIAYDGMQQSISFSNMLYQNNENMLNSLTPVNSATLTPMHLRKAKLMFFWVRYPSSAVLKMYFPDIKFNKNNTAQLVKWFSNFREFYYIQMEKYARTAVTEGMKTYDEIHVGPDSEIYRVLNLHYNRNNHIEVPTNFRFVVEQTLREFFKAIQGGKDTEQSWKKSIYKIISRMDDPVPEYFKSPNFLEQLE